MADALLNLWKLVLRLYVWGGKNRWAVILIDMQAGFLECISHRTQKKLIKNQVQVLEYCRLNSIPLIILEYEGYGRTHKKLMRKAKKIPKCIIIQKCLNNGFTNPGLEKCLLELRIKTVLLMGINADYCVKSTGLSAIHHGFRIVTANSLIAGMPSHSKDNSAEWYQCNGIFADTHRDILSELTI